MSEDNMFIGSILIVMGMFLFSMLLVFNVETSRAKTKYHSAINEKYELYTSGKKIVEFDNEFVKLLPCIKDKNNYKKIIALNSILKDIDPRFDLKNIIKNAYKKNVLCPNTNRMWYKHIGNDKLDVHFDCPVHKYTVGYTHPDLNKLVFPVVKD